MDALRRKGVEPRQNTDNIPVSTEAGRRQARTRVSGTRMRAEGCQQRLFGVGMMPEKNRFSRSENIDRVEEKLIRVPVREIYSEPGGHSSFDWVDEEGENHSIPLHRIKDVLKDGQLTWHRAQ